MKIRLKSPSSIAAQLKGFKLAHGKEYVNVHSFQNLIAMISHRGWLLKIGSLNNVGNYVFDEKALEFEEDELLELMERYNLDLEYIECGLLKQKENGNYVLHDSCFSRERDFGPRQYNCGHGPTTHTMNALDDHRMPDGSTIPRPKTVTKMGDIMGKRSKRNKKQRQAQMFGPNGPRKIQVSYPNPAPEEPIEEVIEAVQSDSVELSERMHPLVQQVQSEYNDLAEQLKRKGEFLEQLKQTITNIGLNEVGLL